MKKLLKGVALVGAAALTVVGVAGTASCGEKKYTGSAEQLISTLLLNVDRTTVQADFELPAVIKDQGFTFDLTYATTSTNLSFVKKTEEGKEPYYQAKIVRPSWESEEETVTARFTATVNVNGTTATSEEFRVKIKREDKPVSPAESFRRLYDTAGDKPACDIKGYVIAKGGHVVSGTFNNAALFISDENGVGCYYAYNTNLTKEEYDSLNVGDFVNVKGTMTIYNGFVEVNQGSKCTIDASHAKLTPLPAAEDVTELFFENNKDLFYKTASYVKLEGLKVKSLVASDAFKSEAGKYLSTMQTVMTLERAGREINVVLNQGMTPFQDAATKTLFDALIAKATVGEYVDVTGYLAYGSTDEPVVFVNAADLVVKTTEPEKTDYEKAAEAIQTATTELGTQVLKPIEVTLPAGVTAALDEESSVAVISENGSKITITPTSTQQTVKLTLTSVSGEVEITQKVTIQAVALSDEEMVDAELEKLSLPVIYFKTGVGTQLPVNGTEFKDVKISYAFKDGENPQVGTITPSNDGKFAANTVFGFNLRETKVVVATLTKGEVSKTKEINVTFKTNATDLSEACTDDAVGALAIVTAYVGENHTTIFDKDKATERTVVDAFWLRATADGDDVFEVYFGGEKFMFDYDGRTQLTAHPEKGSQITVIGKIVKYVNSKTKAVTWEFSKDGALFDPVKSIAKCIQEEYKEDITTLVNLPTKCGEDTYAYSLVGTPATVTLSGNVLTIKPTETEETVQLRVDLGNGTQTITFKTGLPKIELTAGTDTLNPTTVHQSGKAYADFEVTGTAGLYKLNVYGGNVEALQFKNGGNGFIVVDSAANVKSLELTITNGTKASTATEKITVEVYGSNTKFASTSATDIEKGTLLTTLERGTEKAEEVLSYSLTSDYKYVAFKVKGAAVYMNQIKIIIV